MKYAQESLGEASCDVGINPRPLVRPPCELIAHWHMSPELPWYAHYISVTVLSILINLVISVTFQAVQSKQAHTTEVTELVIPVPSCPRCRRNLYHKLKDFCIPAEV